MPPKNPAKNPAESPAETAGVFGYSEEIAAMIEAEGPDNVFVVVTRLRDDQPESPEHCGTYAGRNWSLDAVRDDHGPGRYVFVVYRTAGRVFRMRRTISVSPRPRTAPAATPAAAAPTAPAPVVPAQFDPMAMMAMMMQQAEQRAAASQQQMTALLQALVTRQHADPIDQLGKLAPLLQRESTSTEALKLADQLARRYKGDRSEREDDDDEGGGVLESLGRMLVPVVQGLMQRPAPASTQPVRRVPNTAPPTPPATHTPHTQPAPQPAPGAQPMPPATPPPMTPDSDTPIDDTPDPADMPEGWAYSAEEMGVLEDCERRAEGMNMHPCLGTVAGVLKLNYENGCSAEAAAEEIQPWFQWWTEQAMSDQKTAANADEHNQATLELAQITEILRGVTAASIEAANNRPSPSLNQLAMFAGVPIDYAEAVARSFFKIACNNGKPTQEAGTGAHPTPAQQGDQGAGAGEASPAPVPPAVPTPTPSPTPAKKPRRRTAN